MRRAATLFVGVVLGLVLGPAALADWDHPVKWEQLEPDVELIGIASYSYDSGWAQVADDFECYETGWITDIEFNGWTFTGCEVISSFRITFWDDVPATVDEESHPADQPLRTIEVGRADPNDPFGLGWQLIDEYTFKINLPEDLWFLQEEGTIYWIGIQGVMNTEEDTFYWVVRDRNADMWNDDAVFASQGHAPWWHLGWPDASEFGYLNIYQGRLPNEWDKSADMSFRLTGIPIPEPASLSLLALAVLALMVRRKR